MLSQKIPQKNRKVSFKKGGEASSSFVYKTKVRQKVLRFLLKL